MQLASRMWWLALGSALGACGSSAPSSAASSAPTVSRESEGSERPAAPDALSVSGLLGTLSQAEIQGALDPRLPKFARCVQQRTAELSWLAGSITLDFHVRLDGSVSSVFPSESTLGDRVAERCMLELAQHTTFPRPHGGEASFRWPLEMPIDPEVREPVALSASEVSSVVAPLGALIDSTCGAGRYSVTAYLDPSGKVLAAGAATVDAASALNLDCVTDAVLDLTFPSPGSYAAKASFTLP